MITSSKLKIWTIITHALILFGAGHGGGFFALMEIFSFPYFTHEHFSFSFNPSIEDHFPVIGLTTLLGQIALLFSILYKHKKVKLTFHLIGIIFLWLSLAYFIYDAKKGSHIYLGAITCIPFVVCTIIAFAGKPIRKIYLWMLDE
jgi:hypothetical protein